MTRLFLLFACAVTLAACDTTDPSIHEEEIVVESYLIAGDTMPRVYLTRSIAINDQFKADRGGVSGASVRIELLNAGGSATSVYLYEPVFGAAGEYAPVEEHGTVLAGRTYRLVADIPGEERITAETTVPGAYDLVSAAPVDLLYRQADQLKFVVTPSVYPNRDAVYIFSIESLDPKPSNLTPLYLDFLYDLGEDDVVDDASLDLSELEAVLVNSSPPINEGNYEVRDDGTLGVNLPWFAVAFHGPNRVVMSALDDNVFDFVRYQQVQAGGSTLSPGEIPNVLDRVENGRGLFGSLTRVEATILVRRP